jgi:hypothetical protein
MNQVATLLSLLTVNFLVFNTVLSSTFCYKSHPDQVEGSTPVLISLRGSGRREAPRNDLPG